MTDPAGPTGPSASPIGSWRATYTPGTWVVLSGPTSMVVLSPAPGKASTLLNDMWVDIVSSSSIDDLIQRLAAFNAQAMPSFAAFFWGAGGLRSLVRGEIKVMDLATGDYVADGAGVQTWSEVGLGGLRQVRIDMTESAPDALQLPLVVGAVTASAVVLDATDEALVSSPQPHRLAASGAPAAPVRPAPAAPPDRTPHDAENDDDEDDVGGSVIVADAAALAAAKPVGSAPAPAAQPAVGPAADDDLDHTDQPDQAVDQPDQPTGDDIEAPAASAAPVSPVSPPVPPPPPASTPTAAGPPRGGLHGVDLTVDEADSSAGDEPADEFDAHPAPSPAPGGPGPGGTGPVGPAPFGPPAGPGVPGPSGPVGVTSASPPPAGPPPWSGAPQGYPQQGQPRPGQQGPGQQGPPQPGQPTGYPTGPNGPYGRPQQPPYGQPGQPGQQGPGQQGPGQQGPPNPYGPPQQNPNQPWGQPPQQQQPPQNWQQAGQQPPAGQPPFGPPNGPPQQWQPGQQQPGQQQPGQPGPGQYGPPPQGQRPPQGHPQQPPQGPPQGQQGPPLGQPSASRPPAPQPSGPASLPEDDADHDGATVFATSLARAHKVADGGQAGGEGLVLADLCVVQHPNPPGATRCRICNGSIPQQGSRLVTRPVLAVLRPSQGQASEVDRPVLIGRSPSADRVPRDQLPRLLTVPSPSHDISRTHVRVTPDGWELTAMDEYSTNGTILVRPGSEPERERLTPGEAVPIYPGNILDLGDGITITVEIPT